MSATQYEINAVENFLKCLARAKKPVKKTAYTHGEILKLDRFKNILKSCKEKNFTEDEIVAAISRASQEAGFEKVLKFSRKEILSLLEDLEEERKTTETAEHKTKSLPDTASNEEENGNED